MSQINDNGIIELYDENDNPIEFEFIHAMNYEDDEYVVLAPVEEEEEEETGVVILRVVVSDDEDDQYESVEDDALLEKLFDQFVQEMQEIEEFEGE